MATETSYFWSGTITGDATLAPISDTVFHGIWSKLFLTDNTVQGVLDGFRNELVVAGVAGSVLIETGAALIEGGFYDNDTAISIAIPTPVANPRIDRIVLRRDWGNQVTRASRLAGIEAGAPVAPTLTQISGAIWEVPLAQILVTTAGVITVADEREFARTPLKPRGARGEIETIELTAPGQFSFTDIPQTFRHLRIDMISRSVEAFNGARDIIIRANNDSSLIYNLQDIAALAAVPTALPALNTNAFFEGVLPGNSTIANMASITIVDIANYTRTNFYKTLVTNYSLPLGFGAGSALTGLSSGIWKDTSAITKLNIFPSGGANQFVSGSRCTLYGIR